MFVCIYSTHTYLEHALAYTHTHSSTKHAEMLRGNIKSTAHADAGTHVCVIHSGVGARHAVPFARADDFRPTSSDGSDGGGGVGVGSDLMQYADSCARVRVRVRCDLSACVRDWLILHLHGMAEINMSCYRHNMLYPHRFD